MQTEKNTAIVFFDGVCGLCNRFVNFMLRKDKKQELLFSPIQGSTAGEILTDEQRQKFDSIIFYDRGAVYYRSAAALRIIARLGKVWKAVLILLVIPSFIRNFIYDVVARNRYHWFGKMDACRLPSPEERERFLP